MAKDKSPQAVQDLFLNQVRKERVMVTVYLVNGYQLKGFVRCFDNFTIVIENEGKLDLIYKHAISTISPGRCPDSLGSSLSTLGGAHGPATPGASGTPGE
ncbi:MAG TPA: RNA chaperone Hfq [Firmicutes bacterium]|nr:RNA chaperone Hfq [Bacillota bacterium]